MLIILNKSPWLLVSFIWGSRVGAARDDIEGTVNVLSTLWKTRGGRLSTRFWVQHTSPFSWKFFNYLTLLKCKNYMGIKKFYNKLKNQGVRIMRINMVTTKRQVWKCSFTLGAVPSVLISHHSSWSMGTREQGAENSASGNKCQFGSIWVNCTKIIQPLTEWTIFEFLLNISITYLFQIMDSFQNSTN